MFFKYFSYLLLLLIFVESQAQEKVYKVGLFEDKPLSFRDTDGGLKGIYIDILEHVALQQGWQLKYKYDASFQNNLKNLEEGKIDILVSIGYSPERAKIYDFTKETVLTNWGEVFVHKDSTIRSILDLEHKKVAVMEGNIYYDGSHGLKNTADQFNLDIDFIEVKSYGEVLKLIDQQKVEAGLISVLYGDMHKEEYEVEGTPIVFHPIELRFALRKGNPDNPAIIKALDDELRNMIDDPNSVYYQSQARWLNRTATTTSYWWLLWGLAIVAGVALLFIIASIVLRKQVQKRTQELVVKNEEIQKLNEGLEQKVKERTAEVVAQKEELEQMNKHMRDSINYARNIQEAILPEKTKIKSYIPEHFVLSMPRDIVSGDFHWFVHDEEENVNLLAVADCTGHGVPGAFMSMLGKSSLDYILHEKQKKYPSDILSALQSDVYRALGENAKDGMDIAICRFDFEQKKLYFAGAQSALYLIRKGEVHVIKGNRYPIGGSTKHYKREREYEQHALDIEPGDLFYMSSDGYPDQFGGPENRKFTSRRFRHLLLDISKKTLEEQRDILEQTHLDWRGKTKQIDDILVIGVRC